MGSLIDRLGRMYRRTGTALFLKMWVNITSVVFTVLLVSILTGFLGTVDLEKDWVVLLIDSMIIGMLLAAFITWVFRFDPDRSVDLLDR